MSSQYSVNRPCFPHKGIITADSAHPKVMILKHAIVSPKKNHNWWHSPPKSLDPKKVIVPKKRIITGCTGYQTVMIPKKSKQKSYDSKNVIVPKNKNHNLWLFSKQMHSLNLTKNRQNQLCLLVLSYVF